MGRINELLTRHRRFVKELTDLKMSYMGKPKGQVFLKRAEQLYRSIKKAKYEIITASSEKNPIKVYRHEVTFRNILNDGTSQLVNTKQFILIDINKQELFDLFNWTREFNDEQGKLQNIVIIHIKTEEIKTFANFF